MFIIPKKNKKFYSKLVLSFGLEIFKQQLYTVFLTMHKQSKKKPKDKFIVTLLLTF